MTLEINGKKVTCPPVANLEELLLYLGVSRDRIAVELNRRIVRRSCWETTPLNSEDHLEIVQFVGGG